MDSPNFVKQKWKKSKLILLIRLSLISVVLCLFYIRFLLLATPQQIVSESDDECECFLIKN